MNTSQVKTLLEKRNEFIAQSRAIEERASSENRKLSTADMAQQNKVDEKVLEYDERLQRAIALLESDQRAQDAAARYGTAPKYDNNDGAPGTARGHMDAPTQHTGALIAPAADFVRSINSGEARASVEIPLETRDETLLSTFTEGSGASTVPHRVHPEIWKHMVHESPLMMLAQTFPTQDGAPLRLSGSESFTSPGIIGEGQQIPVDNPTFSAIEFDAFKIAAMGSVTNELNQDNSVGIAAWSMQQGIEALGRSANVYFATGTGTDEPQGIDKANVGHTLAGAAAIELDDLITAQHSINPSYRPNGSWVLGDATLAEVRKLKDGDGNYLWRPANILGQPDTLLGSPVYSDPSFKQLGEAGAVIGVFGDFKRGYGIRMAGSIRMDTSDHFAFDHDLLSLRFVMRADGRIIDPRALTAIATP